MSSTIARAAAQIHRMAAAARDGSYRGPGAMTAVAFAHLLQLGAAPLDFMHNVGRGHAFLVIGRKLPELAESIEDDDGLHDHTELGSRRLGEAPPMKGPESWGLEAVVCDPARGLVFRQPEILSTEYYKDYDPAESQLRFERLTERPRR